MNELDTPTRAPIVPMKNKRRNSFSASAYAGLRRDKTANPPSFHYGAARRHRSSLKLPPSLVSYGGQDGPTGARLGALVLGP